MAASDFGLSVEEREALEENVCSCYSRPGHVAEVLAPAVMQIVEDRTADLAAQVARVRAVLDDEPPLLRQIRDDMGAGFPNELSERRGATITGWVDRLRAALSSAQPCTCSGEQRFSGVPDPECPVHASPAQPDTGGI